MNNEQATLRLPCRINRFVIYLRHGSPAVCDCGSEAAAEEVRQLQMRLTEANKNEN